MATPDLSWAWAPGPLIALALSLTIYLLRWRRARRAGGATAAGGWRLVSFCAGLALIFVALVTPVDRLGEQLFVAHMAQHILLIDLGPILLLLGLTGAVLGPVAVWLRRLERRAGVLSHPAFAVVFYGATLWLWHAPAMYELALREPLAHAVQHVHFLSAGLLFWWHLQSPIRMRKRLRGLAVVGYLFGAKLITGVLASALAFTPLGLYAFYSEQPRWWGLSAVNDQRMAGGLMMTEELVAMTTAVVIVFIRMLGESERESDREQERHERSGLAR
ncbi:MAG: hypothetical protein QOC64_2360 [Solirubrobacteraceae bacterium]|nr:hypothetical protein [Solirubrobacteraceae bacterium]